MRTVLCTVLLMLWPMLAAGQPAFPGAEGFGAASVGGRGGQVLHVTNLNADGPGSLAAAGAVPGAKIIVFDVGGVIEGLIKIKEPNNTTIAGQTAPGGITIKGKLWADSKNWGKLYDDPTRVPANHDLIVRHVRVRWGDADVGRIYRDCLDFWEVDRLILDHCSAAWSQDLACSLGWSSNITVQWCTIEEASTDGESHGMLWGYAGRNLTLHHNLFAHSELRAPLCGAEPMDHRNNVIYDYGGALLWHVPGNVHPKGTNQYRPGERFQTNLVANYFKAGPSAPKAGVEGYQWQSIGYRPHRANIYQSGNYFSWLAEPYLDLRDWIKPTWQDKTHIGAWCGLPEDLHDTPFTENPSTGEPIPGVVTQTAEEAYDTVLDCAGCWPRDVVTLRTIQETRDGTGSWGKHTPAEDLAAGLTFGTAPLDTDQDGMPDTWEIAHGLDPNDPADRNAIVPPGISVDDRHAGYTFVEYYINELADELVGGEPPTELEILRQQVAELEATVAALTTQVAGVQDANGMLQAECDAQQAVIDAVRVALGGER